MKQVKLNNLQIADLCREISLMIHAGVSLGDGLALLAEGRFRNGETSA